MNGRSVFATALTFAVAAFSACTSPMINTVPDVVVPPGDQTTAEAYPSLAELYGGNAGIYRGCGPNGNVCHNARQYPNMNSLGAIQFNIGRPCNQLQDDPTHIDDWCERIGDIVQIGDATLQLGYLAQVTEASDTMGARWAISVQGSFPTLMPDSRLSIHRDPRNGDPQRLLDLGPLEADPTNPGLAYVQLNMDDNNTATTLSHAGIPGDPEAIQFGDPNRNGTYGHAFGAALILPGHPELSYIIKRLTDPNAGPLMPLANCCFWTKPALRALWCWIAGLSPDGSNAMDPIDYGHCPAGPVENVLYPDPGPDCMAAGMCPVRERGPIPDDPSWANVYANILTYRCNGGGCHFDSAAGGLDMHSSDSAYAALVNSTPPRVVAGNSAGSLMYGRLTQACPPAHTCQRMPLGAPALPDNELGLIDRWISSGAQHDGSLDAGVITPPPDAGGVDAATRPDVVTPPPDVAMVRDVPPVIDVPPAPEAGPDVTVVDDALDAAGE